MKRAVLLIITIQIATTLGLLLAIGFQVFRLGVRGEWEWPRIDAQGSWPDLVFAGIAIAVYSGFVAFGQRLLCARAGLIREAGLLGLLCIAGIGVQFTVIEGAPYGYGLGRWAIALGSPGSSGYYTLAKREIVDSKSFLADYPHWIQKQDVLHIGTHPPGLLLVHHAAERLMSRNERLAKKVTSLTPRSVTEAFGILSQRDRSLTPTDLAALTIIGALTLVCCVITLIPLYLLARKIVDAPSAWFAASLWPLVPSAILFQPTADTAIPLLATSALAAASWSSNRTEKTCRWLALPAGSFLAIGMLFTLGFLPIGLITAIVLLSEKRGGLRRLLLTGAGFLLPTLLYWVLWQGNPFAVWWSNLRNHALFYASYHRSYGSWVIANPIELAIGLGLPVVVCLIAAMTKPKSMPLVAIATLAVIVLLDLSGKNAGEVGRLWLPLMPPLIVGTAAVASRFHSAGLALAVATALLGIQTLALEQMIQVIYPF